MSTPAIELREITVSFGSVLALDRVSLFVAPGSRVAVVGENGAGKSTLMKVLFGLLSPAQGAIYREGELCRFASPRDAIQAGIGMVQQHFDLIAPFTVAENVILGHERQRWGRLDREAAHEAIRRLAQESGLAIEPQQRVEALSVAAQQRVEILKALYRRAQVLILDEPTATLAPAEARELWAATERLAARGTSIVFITHKLDEVMAHADTVLVLRRGKQVLTCATKETSSTALAMAMVGSTPTQEAPLAPAREASDHESLQLEQLCVRGESGARAVEGISLTLQPGEIVGLAGVDGSGQLELIEALVGLRPQEKGTIRVGSQRWETLSLAQRRAAGLAFIPEDRHRYAVALRLSLAENSVLGRHRERRFCSRWGVLRRQEQAGFLAECAATFDLRGSENPEAELASLSGGNQQKLVLARELSRQPRFVIAAQPTRGLDFAATAAIHARLRQAAQEGAAVLVQSLDLDELLALSDRVAVLLKGRLVGILPRERASVESIGALMTGAAA